MGHAKNFADEFTSFHSNEIAHHANPTREKVVASLFLLPTKVSTFFSIIHSTFFLSLRSINQGVFPSGWNIIILYNIKWNNDDVEMGNHAEKKEAGKHF